MAHFMHVLSLRDFFGSPIHKYGGSLGVVVLVVGLSINFVDQYKQYRAVLHGYSQTNRGEGANQ